jgi:hypothetical protein
MVDTMRQLASLEEDKIKGLLSVPRTTIDMGEESPAHQLLLYLGCLSL